MEWNKGLFLALCILDRKIGFPEVIDFRGAYLHHVSRCSSVTISYQIIVRILSVIPSQPVENITKRMNQGFFIGGVCD